MPDNRIWPSDLTSSANLGANPTRGPDKMLAINKSTGSDLKSSGRVILSKAGSILLRLAFSRLAASACGSISTECNSPAPNLKAAIASIPEPHP